VQVAFKHEATNSYLHSHDMKYRQPIAGQQEVTAVPGKNANCRWITEVCHNLHSFFSFISFSPLVSFVLSHFRLFLLSSAGGHLLP
jgi:dolichyl-phosphate-mannose--protein O-mannosyl transferase